MPYVVFRKEESEVSVGGGGVGVRGSNEFVWKGTDRVGTIRRCHSLVQRHLRNGWLSFPRDALEATAFASEARW